MIVNMLRAVSQILTVPKTSGTVDTEIVTKVQCAKLMLDEIVKGMDNKPDMLSPAPHFPITPEAPSAPLPPPPKPEPVYTLDVNPQTKVLRWMKKDGKPLKPTQLLMIDGKEVEYLKAIGMAFKNLKVVEDDEQ